MLNKNSVHVLQTGYTTVSACFLNDKARYSPAWHEASKIRSEKTTVNELLQIMQHNLASLASATNQSYTYKMPKGLCKPGNMAIVETNSGLKTVYIKEVHDEPDIDPDADFDYRWIVCPVRYDIYFDVLVREQRLKLALRNVEKTRQTELVRQQVLGQLPEDKRNAFEQAIAATSDMSTIEHKPDSE